MVNILLIVADQLSFRAVSAYGGWNRTPQIDRIAAAGARFASCYTSCPLCQPARASFWTGRFPHETGVLSNGRKHRVPPVPDAMPTLGELFRRAGYATRHFGKTHDAGALRGFEIEPVRALPVAPDHEAWPIGDDTARDRDTTERVVDFLRTYRGRPFLAVADLNNPHDICEWVGRNRGPHRDTPVPVRLPPLPPNFADADFEQRPLSVQYICCTHNRLAQTEGWTDENYGHYLAAYDHYVSRLDAEVGRLIDALHARPDAADTLLVFFADHGDGMAAHRMVTKQVSFYEEVTRVPLLMAGPGVERGIVCEEPLASLLDLLPTLCDAAGRGAPAGLWGRSLLPWARGGQRLGSPHAYVASEWHTEWGVTVEPGRMIRTPRHKYVRYREEDGEELYDLVDDPGETRTLVADPAQATALQRHRRLLDEHVAATADPFFSLGFDVDPRWRSHRPAYRHHTGPAAPMVDAAAPSAP